VFIIVGAIIYATYSVLGSRVMPRTDLLTGLWLVFAGAAFLAGTTSVVSLVFLQYASFSYRESKKMSIELNNILRKLNISTLNIENISITDSLENSNIEPMTPPIQVKLK
jgi:hypothetical protein